MNQYGLLSAARALNAAFLGISLISTIL